MTSSTVFTTSNRSQAVRLPTPVAFPEDVHRWDDPFLSGPRVSEDFMSECE